MLETDYIKQPYKTQLSFMLTKRALVQSEGKRAWAQVPWGMFLHVLDCQCSALGKSAGSVTLIAHCGLFMFVFVFGRMYVDGYRAMCV